MFSFREENLPSITYSFIHVLDSNTIHYISVQKLVCTYYNVINSTTTNDIVY